jgi:co-chaperonin GroES (HSP10)
MKAIGRNLVISKKKQGTTETKGGLLIAEKQREDIRYAEALVVSAGNEVVGVNEGDVIYYDRHAGHQIEFESKMYHVIRMQDVVVVA